MAIATYKTLGKLMRSDMIYVMPPKYFFGVLQFLLGVTNLTAKEMKAVYDSREGLLDKIESLIKEQEKGMRGDNPPVSQNALDLMREVSKIPREATQIVSSALLGMSAGTEKFLKEQEEIFYR